MIQAVVFDAHGVVLSGERFRMPLKRSHHTSPGQILQFLKDEVRKTLSGHADAKEILAKYFGRSEWEKKREHFLTYWFATEQYVDKALVSYIMRLRHKGILCFLATNQEKYKTEYIRRQMGLELVFDKIFSSSEIGVKKPDSKFFEAIMAEVPRLSPDEILYWDDTELIVEKAREFGFQAEVYKNFDDFQIKMSRYVDMPFPETIIEKNSKNFR